MKHHIDRADFLNLLTQYGASVQSFDSDSSFKAVPVILQKPHQLPDYRLEPGDLILYCDPSLSFKIGLCTQFDVAPDPPGLEFQPALFGYRNKIYCLVSQMKVQYIADQAIYRVLGLIRFLPSAPLCSEYDILAYEHASVFLPSGYVIIGPGSATLILSSAYSIATPGSATRFLASAYTIATPMTASRLLAAAYAILEAPDQVTGASCLTQSSSSIYVSWNELPGIDHYELHRSTVNDFTPTSSTRIALPEVAHYLDDGLQLATTYHYKICAVDAEGMSGAYSTQVTCTTVDPYPPKPEWLDVYCDSDLLMWFDWEYLPDSKCAHVEIHRSTQQGFTPSSSTLIHITEVNVSQWSDENPVAAGTYYARVRGVSAEGLKGPYSDEASVVMADPCP